MEQIAEMLDPSQISVLFETMNVSGVKNQKENPKNPPKKKKRLLVSPKLSISLKRPN
jgi:hypothetical protein